MHVYLSSKIYSMKRLLLLTIPLLFNSTISYAQCNTPITLNNILDQNICSGESLTLTANAIAIPLVITSVFDGPLTGGTPKGIELYVINDINDLSEYGLGSANNGGGTDGEEFTFPVTSASAGQYIYLASDSAQFNNWFGFDTDYITSAVNINGDDAIELFHLGDVIDLFGDINLDGSGEPWDYLDGWAYRNSSTGPDGSVFALSSWSFSGPNALDGELLNSTAGSPVPIGMFTHASNIIINTYTMDVTAAGSMDYIFAGDFSGADPAINVALGDTLIFNVNSPSHPFWINATQGTGTSNGVVVTNNGIGSGTITWVPTTAGTYYYNCQFHSMMTNTITVGAPAISYAWDNGVSNGVPFIPTSSGDYIVVANDAFGCTDTETVTVTVNPLPAVDAGTYVQICDGDTVTLSGAGASTYIWDNGIADGVLFIPSTTTLYTVTGTDANGCSGSDTVSIGVWNLPIVDAGSDQTICSGDSVTLTGVGASSFSWDNGVSDAILFTPLSTATYTVTGTDGNACVNSDQVLVTVNALPTVSGGLDVAVCAGDSAILNGSGAVSYAWDNGITDGVHFIPAANTYTVTGTDGNGCENTDQVDVTINPLPTVGAGADQTVCEGDLVTVSGTGASSYTWDNGVSDGVAFNATTTTTYNLTGVDVNGCENTDSLTIVVEECTGIVEIMNSSLTIYPNPTSDQIIIDIKGYNGRINIEVYDLSGRLLETTTNTTVSLKKQAKGIYVFKVSYGEITEEIRVVRD